MGCAVVMREVAGRGGAWDELGAPGNWPPDLGEARDPMCNRMLHT
jgi:hypothetical protein